MYIGLHVKCRLLLLDYNENWIFWTVFFFRNTKISFKSFQWEPSCCMRTDRHDETNSRFSRFLRKAPKTVRKNYAIVQRRMIFEVTAVVSNKISLSFRPADKKHKIYRVCLPESKWQPAGQDSHKRVAKVQRERGVFYSWVEIMDVKWRHFLLVQGNTVATSYASRRDVSRN